jgi:transposase InsO family protein
VAAAHQPEHGQTHPTQRLSLVRPDGTREKGGFTSVTRTAEEGGQTVNVDLCFVPAVHAPDQKLPAVSGSSGRLIVERLPDPSAARSWPGQVFADPDQPYATAMQSFVAASQARDQGQLAPASADSASATRERLRQLRLEAATLQAQRRIVREQRRHQDAAWRVIQAQREQTVYDQRLAVIRDYAAYRAQELEWCQLKQQRQERLARREHEDAAWRQQRLHLRQALADTPIVTDWRAVLIVTDNCTRVCYGLPLFMSGPHVTAEQVVAQLRARLPSSVQFVISDRGTHFTAHAFAQFAHEADFIHVPIARHRPESNGIAERCVRTLKEWLLQYAWQSDDELEELLHQFCAMYNDRPHQGIGIPGLSPNEFARRIWLF